MAGGGGVGGGVVWGSGRGVKLPEADTRKIRGLSIPGAYGVCFF